MSIRQDKPFSQACENNKQPIAQAMAHLMQEVTHVQEIGSGTGQHAVYFAKQWPHLVWQTADMPSNHAAINAWINDSGLSNVRAPFALEVSSYAWPEATWQAAFCANSIHIMSWAKAQQLITKAAGALQQKGWLFLYGPFNYAGKYTSDSNARFDQWLKERDPKSGIREFEQVNALAEEAGLRLQQDTALPANNRLLVWQKSV